MHENIFEHAGQGGGGTLLQQGAIHGVGLGKNLPPSHPPSLPPSLPSDLPDVVHEDIVEHAGQGGGGTLL